MQLGGGTIYGTKIGINIKMCYFRDELFEKEYSFAKQISDPNFVAQWWDDFFLEIHEKYPKIKKNSSKFRIKLRLILFLLGNRLYMKKFKKLLGIDIN